MYYVLFWKVRALRKQLRKSHEAVVASQQRAGEMQDEILRLSDVNRKLETLVGKKRLVERDQLTVQMEQVTQQLTNRENRITVSDTAYTKIVCRNCLPMKL